MNTLYETDQLILEYDYETAWLKLKSTGVVLFEDYFYGEPTCGLIDTECNWAIIAGDHIMVWTPTESKRIKPDGVG